MTLLDAQKILIIQPENPDGDSVASALALEEILCDAGKDIYLYSYVDIPKYLSYIEGYDRFNIDFPSSFDATIIVDTTSSSLLENTLSKHSKALSSRPIFVFDHHATEKTLNLPNLTIINTPDTAVSTGEVVYHFANNNKLPINHRAATHIMESMLSDTLGLTTQSVSADTFKTMACLTSLGADISKIDKKRRESSLKPTSIIAYKGALLQRIEYHLEGKLATVIIPHQEIVSYSPHYNPAVLVLEELRAAEGVVVAVVFKSYQDGKITAKIRTYTEPIARAVAEHFGGGGHDYAAGFKLTENTKKVDQVLAEVVQFTHSLLSDKE